MRERIGDLPPTPESVQAFVREGFVAVEGDMLHFCDPVTRERYEPGSVPPSIQDDEMYREGMAMLREIGEVTFVANRHKDEYDLDPLQKRGFLAGCAAVGMEWSSAPGHAKPGDLSEICFDTMPDKGMGRYIRQTSEWLAGEGILPVPIDIDTPISEDDALRLRLVQLWEMAGQASQKIHKGQRHEVTVDELMQQHLGWAAYHHNRQYLMPAHLGFMVARAREHLLPGGIGMVVGYGHLPGIPQKLRQSGVRIREVIAFEAPDDTMNREIFTKAMPNGQISLDALRRVAEAELRQ